MKCFLLSIDSTATNARNIYMQRQHTNLHTSTLYKSNSYTTPILSAQTSRSTTRTLVHIFMASLPSPSLASRAIQGSCTQGFVAFIFLSPRRVACSCVSELSRLSNHYPGRASPQTPASPPQHRPFLASHLTSGTRGSKHLLPRSSASLFTPPSPPTA